MELADQFAVHDIGPATGGALTCHRCGCVVDERLMVPDVCSPPAPAPAVDPLQVTWVTVNLDALPAGAPRPTGPVAALRGYEATELDFDVHHGDDSHTCPQVGCPGDHLWAILTSPTTHRVIYCPGKDHR